MTSGDLLRCRFTGWFYGTLEVTDDVLTKSDARHNVSPVPVYAHITHKALKDIPKEDTNPDNCKVRALAFNNKNKV